MKRIIILTGSELRHEFFRKRIALSENIIVLQSYCEFNEIGNQNLITNDLGDSVMRVSHLKRREQTEKDFFELFTKNVDDLSNPKFLKKGTINFDQHVNEITLLQPDLIIAYGCSIIRSSLLKDFNLRFINVHLGLSPYYRGSGTNFWPFVNNEIPCVGTTFMYIDEGIDTGSIIHQIRARVFQGDDFHQIGNRLIMDSAEVLIKIIENIENCPVEVKKITPKLERVYKKKDYTEFAVDLAYNNLKRGCIEEYIYNKDSADRKFPIYQNLKIC